MSDLHVTKLVFRSGVNVNWNIRTNWMKVNFRWVLLLLLLILSSVILSGGGIDCGMGQDCVNIVSKREVKEVSMNLKIEKLSTT